VPVKLGKINPVYDWVKKMTLNISKKIFSVLFTSIFLLSFNIAPALAAAETYFAGGGADDGLVTEITWNDISDEDLSIADAGFGLLPGFGDGPRTEDAFDVFGRVWVRTGGNWYQIDGTFSLGGGRGGPADATSPIYEVTITRTVNSVLVTATLTIVNNRAKWSVTTSAPVERIAVLGNLGSDGNEVWYQQSTNVWWSNDGGTDSGIDPLLRFETSTNGTLRQDQRMPSDGLTGSGFAGTQSSELVSFTGRDIDPDIPQGDNVISLSGETVSEFSLSICIFDYDSDSGFDDVTARNNYIDNLAVESCGETSVSAPWVGAQSITCPAPNPWVKEKLGFASNAKPVLVSAENTIGKTITQGSYDALKSSGVVFDTVSTKVSTATETLPIYGCKDKLLSGKVNQPIQFIAGGYTLQSDAHGYINTSDLKWHDTNGVTLYTNTAAFMHTIKFTKKGKYVVVLTEQPDTSRGLIPTYGVRSIRFVININ
jgi:hypothetical protein